MSRLTKFKNGKFQLNNSSIDDVVNKLGKLENFEDEFKLSLLEILEIDQEMNRDLGAWVYVKNKNQSIDMYFTDDYTVNTMLAFGCFVLQDHEDNEWIHLYFCDYKKIWSLNKGDLIYED